MVQDQTRIGDMGVEEFILPAAIVEVTVVDLAVLIDVIIQGEFGLGEGLPINNDVIRFESHMSVSGEL